MKSTEEPVFITGEQTNASFKLTWNHIEQGINILQEKISDLYHFDCILAVARGGLIPAVFLSHRSDCRKMLFFQGIRTNTNNPHDYCDTTVTLLPEISPGQRVLIVEDIIYKGETIKLAVEHVQNNGGTVVAVCSLVIDENFEERGNLKNLPIISAFKCAGEKWIRFPWEQPIDGEIIPYYQNKNLLEKS